MGTALPVALAFSLCLCCDSSICSRVRPAEKVLILAFRLSSSEEDEASLGFESLPFMDDTADLVSSFFSASLTVVPARPSPIFHAGLETPAAAPLPAAEAGFCALSAASSDGAESGGRFVPLVLLSAMPAPRQSQLWCNSR